ncbi:MAG TPA: type VI secretion system membrane subunit TssM [Gammaproteobacteria bacterium]|nr:type VI secretion system membrane subunit TssM [Gammaproteobacteria bacterium]
MGGGFFGIIRQFVMSRGGSTLIGLVALLALVWFGLPFVGVRSTNTRLIIIGVILGVAALYWLITWLVARRRGKAFQKDLQGQQDGRQAELEALKGKMTEAISSLKSSELGIRYRGTAALYALPWFMIIGPSAAGKSTLLRNSGLHFPYAHSDDVDIKGFGGTRNCDWWFSDEAVILDTAGRYTTEEDDHEEWVSFLQLLKRHRRKMPINGIIIAVSIADLLTADEESLEWHVKVIRERIEELTQHLGFLFPLYLVFTKCDLLNGFQAYFGELGERERAQVWGAFMEGFKSKEDPTEKIANCMDQLYARLCDQRLRKLSMQRKHAIKAEIYDFPAQFQAATEKLLEFITLLFKDNPYQETPNFRGVYFTSGTQEGLPLQRVVGNLRQAFGQVEQKSDEHPRSEKSYFINELLLKVIFKAPRDALMSRRKQLVTRGFKSATVLLSLAAIIGSVLMFSTAFTTNALSLKKGTDAVEYLASVSHNDRAASVEEYDALAEVYQHYLDLKQAQQEPTWQRRFRLYRANEQLEPLEALLVSYMEKRFMAPVGRALEQRLQHFATLWEAANQDERARMRNEYYETLKTYLMLGDPRRLNRSEAMPLLYKTWRAVIAPAGDGLARTQLAKIPEERLKGMVAFYLAHMKLPTSHRMAASGWQVTPAYVERARDYLRTPPNAEILYAQLRNKGKVMLKNLSLPRVLKSRGASYLETDYQLPVLFTRAGWETFASREIAIMVDSASRGDWVMGTQQVRVRGEAARDVDAEVDTALMEDLQREMRLLYFAEYNRTWHEFLRSISIAEFSSIPDAARKLLLLSRSDGPLGELMELVGDNVQLYEVVWDVKTIGKPGEKGRRLKKPVRELDATFADLRRFSVPAPKKTVSDLLNQYLMALAAMQAEMEQLRGSSELERDAEMFAANILAGRGGNSELYKGWVNTTSLLNGTDVRTRRVIEPMLMAPVKHTWKVVLATAMEEVQLKWNNMVVAEFNERIRGRFPFASRGPDAAIDDVAEFFRPDDGILWSFVNQHLSSYLVKHRSRWKERQWLGMGPQFEKGFINALNRSQAITRGLFKRGGDTPSVTFYLYPMPTAGLSEVLIETNGQMYRYRNEPQEWRRFTWPGSAERSGARIIGVSDRNNARAEITAQGLWGLFHLFKKAKVVKERGAQYLSMWKMESVNGKPILVQFKVKADRYNNVFRPGLMTGLRMPETMTAMVRRSPSLAHRE